MVAVSSLIQAFLEFAKLFLARHIARPNKLCTASQQIVYCEKVLYYPQGKTLYCTHLHMLRRTHHCAIVIKYAIHTAHVPLFPRVVKHGKTQLKATTAKECNVA